MNRVKDYYPSSFNRNQSTFPKIMRESFINHDPMIHHKFLKDIYGNEKIIGDTNFNEVIKLDTFEYLKRLEEIYR
jgi:hypothetical protein